MLVPLTTRTWIDDAPGTMVGHRGGGRDRAVVRGRRGRRRRGGLAGGGSRRSGARVAEGMSSAPMTTATTTTPTPRSKPEARRTTRRVAIGPVRRDPPPGHPERARFVVALAHRRGWCGAAVVSNRPRRWSSRRRRKRRTTRGAWSSASLGVDELRQPAVVPGRRHSQTVADARCLGFGPGPPRFLEVEDLAVLVCQSHRGVKPANAPRAKQGSSVRRPVVPGTRQDRR